MRSGGTSQGAGRGHPDARSSRDGRQAARVGGWLRRRHAGASILVTILLLGVLRPVPASADPDLTKTWYWSPGTAFPTKVLLWPDWYSGNGNLREAARFDVRLGWSPVDSSRVPEQGESFYLRITFRQTAPNALMSFNAAPQIQLPSGLVRADDRLPVRCAAILPPQTTWTEYVNGCGLAGTAPVTVVSKAGVNPAPAFRMTPGTQWIWDIPVRSTAPLNFAPLKVSMWANEAGVWGSTTDLSGSAFTGASDAAIWRYYKSAPRRINQGVLRDELGYPDGPEQPVPWQWQNSAGNGSYQDFQNDPVVVTVTWSPVWGAHRVTGTFRDLWRQRASALGPAKGDAKWDASYTYQTQEFAGGRIRYSDMSGTTTVSTYCMDVNSMNC